MSAGAKLAEPAAPPPVRDAGGGVRDNRWLMLFLLTAIYICNNIDRHAIAVLGEPIRRDLGLSDTQLGLLTGLVFAVFYAVFGIPAGWIADRFGRVRTIAIACALWSTCSALSGLSRNFAQLALSRIGVGIGEAGGTAPSYSLIASRFEAHERGRAMGYFSLGSPLAALLAVSGAGWAAAEFGWRTSLVAVSLPGVVLALVLWLVVREPRNPATTGDTGPGFAATLRLFGTSRVLPFAAVASGMSAMISYAYSAWLPTYLVRIKGIGMGELAAWFSVTNALAIALGLGLGGWLCDRLVVRSRSAYAVIPCIAMLAGAPGHLVAMLMPGWEATVVALFLPLVASGMFLAPMLALVQAEAPERCRSQFAALYLLINNLIGSGAGPLYVGVISDLARPTWGEQALSAGLIMMVPLFLAASAAHFLLMRRLARRPEAIA